VWVGDKLVVATSVATKPGDAPDADVLVLAYDSRGTELWRRTIGGEGSQFVSDLAATEQRIRLIVSSDHTFDFAGEKLVARRVPGVLGDPRFELMLDGAGQPVSGRSDALTAEDNNGSIGLPDGTFAEVRVHEVGTGPNKPPSAVLRHFDARGTTLWQTKITNLASTDLVIPSWSATTVLFTAENTRDDDLGVVVAADLAKHELHRSKRISVNETLVIPTPDGLRLVAQLTNDPDAEKPIQITAFTTALVRTHSNRVVLDRKYDLRFMTGAALPDGTVWLSASTHPHPSAVVMRLSPADVIEAEISLPGFVFAPTPVIAGRHVALTGWCASPTHDAHRLCIQFVKID